MLRLLSDSGIFFSDFIPACIILSALFADPSTIMLKLLCASSCRARGRGGKGGQGGRDGSAAGGEAPGVQEFKERTPGHSLSFILKSTLISDVYFSCSGSHRSATTTKSPTAT